MFSFWSDYGLFLLKSTTIVLLCVILLFLLLILISALRSPKKSDDAGELEIESLTERYQCLKQDLLKTFAQKKELKSYQKSCKQNIDPDKPRLFVTRFDGDIQASAVTQLREVITAILFIAKPDDQVLLILESQGGLVHQYGLAASQLYRLRERKIMLTVSVDRVAASGGYLMACVANQIVAAPFSIIGSIGVIAQIPNFNRFLKNKNIDIEQHTAGEYKATLTMLGEITPKQRTKFKEELEETHALFKTFVSDLRPNLDMKAVATGEHWYGEDAIKNGLIDRLQTSDDFLLEQFEEFQLYELKFQEKRKLKEKLFGFLSLIQNMMFSYNIK